MTPARVRDALDRTAKALAAVKTNGSLLDEVAWPREVEERFFAEGAAKLPVVAYEIDGDALEREVAALRAVEADVRGDGAISLWLRSTIASNIDRNRLLLSVGTREFGRISREVYGGARSSFFDLEVQNLDLAEHLLGRLEVHGWDAAGAMDDDEALDAGALARSLEERIAKRRAPIKVVLDPACTAKVVAGMKRVRVRPDATFTAWEAEGLYRHEVETHSYTALNGSESPYAPLLRSGGPRSTPTQEGLAVFAELYHRALPVARLRRLALRVKLVGMAENGASFLDVYRHLVQGEGLAPRDAYLDAARVFRGSPPAGGAPFTKDACYLAGLVHVHAFLAAFVRAGFRDECEMLVCGRFALDDITAMVQLRAMGLLERPRWRPRWLREWGTLLPYFAFASFLDGIDLGRVSRHYGEVIALAAAARPPRS